MDYAMAALDLVWDPTDQEEVLDVLDMVTELFNVSFIGYGMSMACLSVSCWDQTRTPIATFMVLDSHNNIPVMLDEAINSVLIALNLEEDIVLLDRQGREDRVGRS